MDFIEKDRHAPWANDSRPENRIALELNSTKIPLHRAHHVLGRHKRAALPHFPLNDQARINAVYKQATLGDCTDTKWETLFENTVLKIWRTYKGTSSLTAKRRFLGLLRDVDPRLLQIEAYYFVPWGFPTSTKGERICPYSNAKHSCPRPLMDKYGHHVEDELGNNDRLSDISTLRKWLDEVETQQRCSLGLHAPISKDMGARFSTFFGRPECGGFQPYTSKGLHKMVKKVVTKHMLYLVEMQNNPRKFSRKAQALQRDRFMGLKQIYKNLSGQEFASEAPCLRDSHHCNTRRLTEWNNHTHSVVIRTPSADYSLYDALIQVRRECERLGIVPVTGPTKSIDHRYRLLQLKVVDFHRKKIIVYESRRRQQWRSNIAPHHGDIVKSFSRQHLSECLRDALVTKDMDRVCLAVESGADPGTEIRGGLFPFMAVILKRSTSHIQRLLAAGAKIDAVNSRGMTPLMWAVKRDDYVMVNVLLEKGADVGVEGCTGWTAMSIAARHGSMDIAQLIVDTLRNDKVTGETDAKRVLNHRSSINAGLTAVAIAAIHRNELMVRFLMRLGAKPEVKCHEGYGAGEHAMMAGWTSLGLWLQKTRAYSSKGVYTFADISAERALRVAGIRMLDAIVTGTAEEDMGDAQKKAASNERRPAATSSSGLLRPPSAYNRFDVFDIFSQTQAHTTTLTTVKVLQEGYAAPDTETNRGHTALISAAYRGLEKCVHELIQEGADPNYTNRNDRTALMAAATAGHHNTVLVLLIHGADPARVDFDGKAAGRYAFEKGFCRLAELLAVAASRGNELALDWEVERRRRTEKGETRKLIEMSTHEADLQQWIIHATKPMDAAHLEEMRQASCQRLASCDPRRCTAMRDDDGTTPQSLQQPRRRERCPKCTLVVPCRHYSSLETLMMQFPDGVPEWEWNKRGVAVKVKLRERNRLMNLCSAKNRMFGGKYDITWLRALHRAHRDREVSPLGSPGEGNHNDGLEGSILT